jgi:hypothetical protein
MEFQRKVGIGLSIAALGLIASIQLAGPAGPLEQGELEVWVPNGFLGAVHGGPFSLITYRWATLLNEFNRDFPKAKLHFKILEREEFLRVLHSTEMKSHPPDIAFVDNWFEAEPLINSGAVTLNSRSRFYPATSWWLLLAHSKNVRTCHAFMLWLSQSPHWKPWMVGPAAMGQDDKAAVQAVSRAVVKDVALGDLHSLSANMDREACRFEMWPDPTYKIVSIDSLITFGNSRLAFVLMSSVGQGARTFGMQHSALVLRKVDNGWKVLQYAREELPALEHFLKAFDRMELENGQPQAIAPVSLVSPVDHARISRFPSGELVWKQLNPLPAAYVLEWQLGQREESWSPSAIMVVSPSRGDFLISVESPLGAGHQPHRWRVWAINRTGVVSISDWRTVDFTD